MLLQVASDLHLEFVGRQWREVIDKLLGTKSNTIIIIAGDLTTYNKLRVTLSYMCDKWKRVIFVAGNHEYYGSTFPFVHALLERTERSLPNLSVLRPGKIVQLDNCRIVGSTLWFRNDPINIAFRKHLSDFEYIKHFEQHVYRVGSEQQLFLTQTVKQGDIVVSHHLSSYPSVHPRFTGSQINRFDLCDMTPLIEERKPSIWIHGHTHDSFDYQIFDTRVICNPFGYFSDDLNPNFDENLIIEV